jgi:hypothetical protein
MKPILLASPPRLPRLPKDAIAITRRFTIGEIDSDTVIPDSPDWLQFLQHLEQCGWRARDCHRYSSHTYTYLNGSCCWHDDPGFGKVACCLLYRHRDVCIDTQLITRHGGLNMRRGDLVIFNANYGHAWIGHGPSVFAMVTVSPIRSVQS